jgi:DNA invertase Pin-like site-specific DNA recombinase
MPPLIGPVKKQVVELRLTLGHSPREIADAAGISLATVYRKKENKKLFNSSEAPRVGHNGRRSVLTAEAVEVG